MKNKFLLTFISVFISLFFMFPFSISADEYDVMPLIYGDYILGSPTSWQSLNNTNFTYPITDELINLVVYYEKQYDFVLSVTNGNNEYMTFLFANDVWDNIEMIIRSSNNEPQYTNPGWTDTYLMWKSPDIDMYATTGDSRFESNVIPPGLNLPNVTLPGQIINTEQNTYLNTNSSSAVKGGSINLFQIDYYNVYTVVQTAESDKFFDSRNDNYYVYQESSDGIGHYIFAVYDYSKLYVFAPNMSVSSSGFTLTFSEAHNIKYSYASSNGLIQRDVNKFEFEYVDKTLNEYFGYDKLPFSNSYDNQNHLEWIGTKTKMLNGQASSMSAALTLNTGTIMTNLHFVITDTTNSYENAQMMNNQTIINNNMNQQFDNVINNLTSGNSNSQASESATNTSNQLLDSTISSYDQLEKSFQNDLDRNLDAINMNFDLGNSLDFVKSANFVKTQFNNLTNDNPFGSLIGFSLAVGLALLIMGRRL